MLKYYLVILHKQLKLNIGNYFKCVPKLKFNNVK